MPHLKRYLAFATIFLIPLAVRAQEPKAPALPKIGIIEFERAVLESSEGLRVGEVYKSKIAERQKEIEAKQKEIEDIANKLRQTNSLLSETSKTQMTKDIETKSKELDRRREEVQIELESLRSQLFKPVADIAATLTRKMATEKGVILFDVSNEEINSFVYWSPKIDFTEELKLRINAETKTSGEVRPEAKPANK